MIQLKTREILPILFSVQYSHTKNEEYDYSQKPRPCHNLVFMLSGEAIIEADNTTIVLRPGNILFIPQNTTYKAVWLAQPTAVFHSLHFAFPPSNNPFSNKNVPIQLLPNDYFEELYQQLIDIKNFQSLKNHNSFMLLSSFYSICGTLFPALQFNNLDEINTAILPAITYIETHYANHFTIEKLAKICHLSISRFHYLFKQQTGMSPIAYKNKILIQYICQELLSNRFANITEICRSYNFQSVVYFERFFKKLTGKTPSQYRKENRLL